MSSTISFTIHRPSSTFNGPPARSPPRLPIASCCDTARIPRRVYLFYVFLHVSLKALNCRGLFASPRASSPSNTSSLPILESQTLSCDHPLLANNLRVYSLSLFIDLVYLAIFSFSLYLSFAVYPALHTRYPIMGANERTHIDIIIFERSFFI